MELVLVQMHVGLATAGVMEYCSTARNLGLLWVTRTDALFSLFLHRCILGAIEQRVQEMSQLHKLKHGISMQGGIRTNSAPPTPLSKRRRRPGFNQPRLPATTEMEDNSDDDDEDGMNGAPRPIAISMVRKKEKQKINNKIMENNAMVGVGSL